MTTRLSPLRSSPFNNKIYSCYVYSVRQLTIYTTSELHSQVMLFHCQSYVVSVCLKWTTHSKNMQITGIFQHIHQSMHSQACMAAKGQHFEHRDPNNNCYCLSLECKITFLLNCCIIIEQTSLVLDNICLANV
jgi:hypothetical protein